MISLNKLQTDKPKLYFVNIAENFGRKLYIPAYFSVEDDNFKRSTVLVDSGADLSIIMLSYLIDLFPHLNGDFSDFIQKTAIKLSSYTNHNIPVIGTIKIKIKFKTTDTFKIVSLYVVKLSDRFQCKHPVIFSLTDMLELELNIKSHKINGKLQPIVYRTLKNNDDEIVNFFENDVMLNIGHTYVDNLKPFEIIDAMFKISPASKFLENDHVMISQDIIPYDEQYNIKLFPSTSNVQNIQNNFIVLGKIQNIGNKSYTGAIKCYIEFVAPTNNFINLSNTSYSDIIQKKLSLISEVSFLTDNCRPIANIHLKENIKFDNLNSNTHNIFSLDFDICDTLNNENAVNNDVDNNNTALSEENSNIIESKAVLTQKEMESFSDKNQSIQLGYNANSPEITPEDLTPTGFSIPTNYFESVEDVILEKNYSKKIWPYVKEIFINKFPHLISLHSLDAGKISNTLGFYKIKLKPNVTLPKTRKCYFHAPLEVKQLREILKVLTNLDIISKASTSGSELSMFASPCFLVAKANKNATARMVINYKLLNELITIEPPILPTLESILQQLRNCSLYSTIDLKNAFNSIKIHPDCRKYTTFACQLGTYQMNALCTGLASSPAILARFTDMILNHVPKRDKDGKIIFDNNNYPLMISDELNYAACYYDDIIIFTKSLDNYEESIKYHFECVNKVASRLAFHKCKISIDKANFCKGKINILGWYVCNNFIQADPKRIQKIVNAPLPRDVTTMRSYLGLIGCLRLVLGFEYLKDISVLTPLTSSTKKFKMTEIHKKVFHEINNKLASAPLYSKIIQSGTTKILMTDAASAGESQYSCVMAQLVQAKHPQSKVPSFINLDDETHQIIYDLKLPYKPIDLLENENDFTHYLENLKLSKPPPHEYLEDDTLGFKQNVNNSLGISLKLLLKVNNCQTKYTTICDNIITYIKEHVMHPLIMEKTYNLDKTKMKNFLLDINKGIISIDKDLLVFDALARILYKSVIIINSTNINDSQKQIIFNAPKLKSSAPLIFLLYERKNILITRPAIIHTNTEYQLAKHRGNFEIVLYHTRTIPGADKAKAIYQLELHALLDALHATEKLRGSDKTICLVDNKTIYYLFHNEIISSSKKLERWGMKLKIDYSNITLGFLSSKNNPSDFLSRMYQVPRHERKRIQLPYYVSNSIHDNIPSLQMNVEEWIQWVTNNPQHLLIETPTISSIIISENNPPQFSLSPQAFNIIYSIKAQKLESELKDFDVTPTALGSKYSYNKIMTNINAVYEPIKQLEKSLTFEKIIKTQQEEYKEIYNLGSTNTEDEFEFKKQKYKIQNNLLYIINKNGIMKLLIPTKLLPIYIALAHLSCNHAGYDKMILNLSLYHHPNLQQKAKLFAKSCLACCITNHYNKSETLGFFPLDQNPGEVLHCDLIESLPTSSGFIHILIIKCPISNYVSLFPMLLKTTNEFLHIFQNFVYPFFHPKALFCDSAKFFVSKKTISVLSLLNCRMIYSTAFSGFSHGGIERLVGLIKISFKKVLTICPTFNWSFLCAIISHLYNTTKLSKSGFSPAEMLFGPNVHMSRNSICNQTMPKLHPNAFIYKDQIQDRFDKLQKIWKIALENIKKDRQYRTDRLNKTRVTRQYNIGDIVFVYDRSKIIGNTRPLKTTFYSNPFIIIALPPRSVIIKKLLDNTVLKRTRNDIRKYVPTDDSFKDLPKIVQKICTKDVPDITKTDLEQLLNTDKIILEEFYNHEIHDDDYNNFILDNNKIIQTEENLEEQTAEAFLEEDTPLLTRSALKTQVKNIPKSVKFQT